MADPRRTGDAEASSIAAGDSVKEHCTRDERCSGTTKQMTTPGLVLSLLPVIARSLVSAHAAPRFHDHEDYYIWAEWT